MQDKSLFWCLGYIMLYMIRISIPFALTTLMMLLFYRLIIILMSTLLSIFKMGLPISVIYLVFSIPALIILVHMYIFIVGPQSGKLAKLTPLVRGSKSMERKVDLAFKLTIKRIQGK